MRTKLETFFLEELHRLLRQSMDERDGWAQDKIYEILCRAYQQISEPKPPMTETQKQAAAQSMSNALGTKWGQGQQKVGVGQQNGWPSPQLREAMSGPDITKLQAEPIRFPATEETSRRLDEQILPSFITPKELREYQCREGSNFKEYVLADPSLGISARITFSKGKK